MVTFSLSEDNRPQALLFLPQEGIVAQSVREQIEKIPTVHPHFWREAPADVGRGIAEKLFDALASFKVTTSRVSMHLQREWRDRLFRQLDSLLDVEEWDARDLPPTRGSFSTFIRMLLILQPTKRPGLGATSDRKLVAAWTLGKNRLTIECLSNDDVKWVLTRHSDGRVERAAGDAKIGRLTDVLAPYCPEVWFGDAE